MKCILIKDTKMPIDAFSKYIFDRFTRGSFERRYSDNMPSSTYYAAFFFDARASVCSVNEDDPACTDYYFFIWWTPDQDLENIAMRVIYKKVIEFLTESRLESEIVDI